MSLEELQKKVLAFRDERDWKQFHNPKDLACAISIEASELLEHFLWKSSRSVDSPVSEDIRDEFADVFNNLLLFADACNIDIYEAVTRKIEKNAKNYPIEKAK
jgi:NTP pyrophosphatase (non-canonical NTP hydrolase)